MHTWTCTQTCAHIFFRGTIITIDYVYSSIYTIHSYLITTIHNFLSTFFSPITIVDMYIWYVAAQFVMILFPSFDPFFCPPFNATTFLHVPLHGKCLLSFVPILWMKMNCRILWFKREKKWLLCSTHTEAVLKHYLRLTSAYSVLSLISI